ncbi:MAG: prepilin-type N-terminal cleavage/methylation domain-containing protein, partial [Thermoplasmata archaeon]|nr:prepilin-type N-terminal cleavage/methylation domain-containing protein [Thermoplasmata archaeon]NIT77949.1 prepilin-type N-terminal cleavage/methylation domain-containing protein [Thermoplasmata archaeon]NIY04319.1 prepilin-type N-terminal cleavage/methylation domain-containing protein [Thermoplasmata archaeon]
MTDAKTQRQRGFTIIELLVVMLIIGIMAGIAVPRFRLSNSRQVELQADELAQKLEMARTKAL